MSPRLTILEAVKKIQVRQDTDKRLESGLLYMPTRPYCGEHATRRSTWYDELLVQVIRARPTLLHD
jgi:hypothetical protein